MDRDAREEPLGKVKQSYQSGRVQRYLSCDAGGGIPKQEGIDQLVRKYQSPVRRFFLNQTLGDEQLSDDLAQETFIKAYVNITKFRGMSSFST